MFLAFTSYDSARAGAEDEARITAQQVETVQLLPAAQVDTMSGELVCYARSVAGVQWTRMENHTLGDDLNPWSEKLFNTLNPFHKGVGGLRPVAMQRAEKIIDQELADARIQVTPPCDAQGNPR